jgi:hypothetical protein
MEAALDKLAHVDSLAPIAIEIESCVLHPAQFFRAPGPATSLIPEKRLLLAILEQAISDFQNNIDATTKKNRARYADAATWVAAEDDGQPCSFVNVCRVLDLDPSYVRRGLWAWRDGQRFGATSDRVPPRRVFRRTSGSRTRATVGAIGVGCPE